MTNRQTNLFAALMLVIMLSLSFFAMLGDSQTMDESSHLPAGYSYITQKDMRINPEHPPLIKDLSGLSVWLWSKISHTHINFPSNIKAWKSDINGQWDFGFSFMYKSGNDADKMLFFGRLPMLLILLLLGFYLFKWTKKLFGSKAALLALFLYSFSPTFIAHGHLVTTDVAASAAIFISLYYFTRWLKNPSAKNLIIAGLIFGLALSAKFSTFLLIPLFLFAAIIWIIVKTITQNQSRGDATELPHSSRTRDSLAMTLKYLGGLILIGIIGLIVLYPIYLYHTWNYPTERQVNDMRFVLNSYANGPDQAPLASCKTLSKIGRCPAELTILMAQKPILRPWAQYFFGLLMVVQRTSGGNTTFFMGEISNTGWKTYFPVVYAIKEPLAFHILTLIALLYSLYLIFKAGAKNVFSRLANWIKINIAEFSMLSFIALYWASSINSPLNIGIRHVLPTFPLIYFLTSRQINKCLTIFSPNNLDGFMKKLNYFGRTLISYSIKYSVISLLLLWQFFSVVFAAPYFLSYFNEIIDGPTNGYKYVVDSNLDWGQDFKRLTNWINNYNSCANIRCDSSLGASCLSRCYAISNPPPEYGKPIEKIYVDYFGGTVGEYYLDGRLIPWSGEKDWKELPSGSYLAVSATFRQSCFGTPAPGFQYPSCYQWLKNFEPIAIIGNSIFVYQIP